MKQHITVEQLNELSNSGKKTLREWWKPKEGDWYFIPKGIQYGSGYGMWEETRWEEETIHCLGYGEVGEGGGGGDRKYMSDIKFESILYGEYGDDNYFEIPVKNVYPLLSIGQMIEFLDEHTEGNYQIQRNGERDGWRLNSDDISFNEKGSKELCDSLWEAVKEVLEQ